MTIHRYAALALVAAMLTSGAATADTTRPDCRTVTITESRETRTTYTRTPALVERRLVTVTRQDCGGSIRTTRDVGEWRILPRTR